MRPGIRQRLGEVASAMSRHTKLDPSGADLRWRHAESALDDAAEAIVRVDMDVQHLEEKHEDRLDKHCRRLDALEKRQDAVEKRLHAVAAAIAVNDATEAPPAT